MNPTVYVITHYVSNHERRKLPIDPRFFDARGNYIFYLIDKKCPDSLQQQRVLFEQTIDNDLYVAGGKYFAEWSFLLAEAKHSFCDYPLYMISSRFYEKNSWLYRDLNEEWDTLFGYLKEYGWGYLPSYDRPLHWIDFKHHPHITAHLSQQTIERVEKHYGLFPPHFSDFFCNYIGFHSRQHLLEYVEFYRPLIDDFFDTHYTPKLPIEDFVSFSGSFWNEKPFTFLLEALSHLFFYKNAVPFCALSYDGYFVVNEKSKTMQPIYLFDIPLSVRLKRMISWQRKKRIEQLKKVPPLYNSLKWMRKTLLR